LRIPFIPLMPPSHSINHPLHGRAFSLPEALIAVAIIGIVASIAVPMITRMPEASRQEVAENIVARLNGALTAHRQCSSDILVDAEVTGAADESTVMNILLTRDDAVPGSPLLSGAGWPSVASSDPKQPRLFWNGRFFEVIAEGNEGTGLRLPR
jgi:prepilin-type N-terminal cleavage/methylation domain-containing protein